MYFHPILLGLLIYASLTTALLLKQIHAKCRGVAKLSGACLSGQTDVFTKCRIQNPVQRVLDLPVSAHRTQRLFGIRRGTADETFALCCYRLPDYFSLSRA